MLCEVGPMVLELEGDEINVDKVEKCITDLERLEQVLARRISLALVHNRVG